ncbi:hypothetical protein MTO96_020612 [Rhipicephalus appendiculatus]
MARASSGAPREKSHHPRRPIGPARPRGGHPAGNCAPPRFLGLGEPRICATADRHLRRNPTGPSLFLATGGLCLGETTRRYALSAD